MSTPSVDRPLAGQIGVVTGGAGGIGAGTTRALAELGMRVVIVDIDADLATHTAQQISEDTGIDVTSRHVDVVDSDAMSALAADITNNLGPVRLLYNNAGVMPMGPILENCVDDWRWLFDVNLIGVANGITAFAPRMLAHGLPSRLLTTASMAAFAPNDAFPIYTASKQAVLGVIEALRMELEGTNIAVSVVCPGAVNTGIGLSERNRPARYGPASGRAVPVGAEQEKARLQLIEGDEAGRRIVREMMADEFWIFTHPEWARKIRSRFDDAYEAAQRALQRRPDIGR
ncbi:MAG: SDR family NAD(P)-dependent oxidoreductase [Acidimicrobiia bacterium]